MFYYLDNLSVNPYYNLALEQYLFDSLGDDDSLLMFWQNYNTVVIGKYQNVYSEVNLQYANDHGINIVRRLSGGGAVYHDLGNLNYSIITKK